MAKAVPDQGHAVDFGALFDRLPTAYLVMDQDLVIVAANQAYERMLDRSRTELVGRPVFEAFPPADDVSNEANPLRASFERARDTGEPDAMPLYKYDVRDPSTGRLAERYWSLISAPVPDDAGRTQWVLQRVEDVTDYVSERAARADQGGDAADWRDTDLVEADVYARAQELRLGLVEEGLATKRQSDLARAALALTEADTDQAIAAAVLQLGVPALQATCGALALRTDDGIDTYVVAGAGSSISRQCETTPNLDLPLHQVASSGQPDHPTLPAGTAAPASTILPINGMLGTLGALQIEWAVDRAVVPTDLELLAALAAQAGQAADRIRASSAEQVATAATRALSETLQRSMLTAPVEPDHLQVAVRYAPAAQEAQIGGDLYDAFLTTDGSTVLVIGDVTGHDTDAAAAMGQLRNLLRGVALAIPEPPAAVLRALDRGMHTLGIASLATAVLAQIRRPADGGGDRTLHWSNAGHPPPLLITPDQPAVLLETPPDLLLGLDPDTPRSDQQVRIPPGSTMVFYTDGLVERRGENLADSLQRLRERADMLRDLPLEDLCDALLAEASSDEDDVALLAICAHNEKTPRPAVAGMPRLTSVAPAPPLEHQDSAQRDDLASSR